MTSIRILEIAAAGIAGVYAALMGGTSAGEVFSALASTANGTTDATGVVWIDRIVGPFGALVLCVVALTIIVRFVNGRIILADTQQKETQSLLISLVKEASANTARLTDQLAENSRVIEEAGALLEDVRDTIGACQAKNQNPKP